MRVEHVGADHGAARAAAAHRVEVGRHALRLPAGGLAAVVRLVPGHVLRHPRVAGAEGLELGGELGRRGQAAGARGAAGAPEGDEHVRVRGARGRHVDVEVAPLLPGAEHVPADDDADVADGEVLPQRVGEHGCAVLADADRRRGRRGGRGKGEGGAEGGEDEREGAREAGAGAERRHAPAIGRRRRSLRPGRRSFGTPANPGGLVPRRRRLGARRGLVRPPGLVTARGRARAPRSSSWPAARSAPR